LAHDAPFAANEVGGKTAPSVRVSLVLPLLPLLPPQAVSASAMAAAAATAESLFLLTTLSIPLGRHPPPG
jgi:hypothetical protein